MSTPYAIVLGAAVWPDGKASPTLRRRAETAAALYHAGQATTIVASGALGQHPPSEAAMIAEIVVGLGVPRGAVILEDRSTTTRENLSFSIGLLPDGAEVVIVTDFWHMPRARFIAKRLGLRATGAAPPLRGATLRGVARASLREIAALLWEFIRPMR